MDPQMLQVVISQKAQRMERIRFKMETNVPSSDVRFPQQGLRAIRRVCLIEGGVISQPTTNPPAIGRLGS